MHQWLKFEEEPKPEWSRRKTKKLLVANIKTNAYLGTIEFYPGWRQYVFQNAFGQIFWSADCLRELAMKIDELEAERKAAIKNVR